jgi:translation initiation factor IF-1
MPKEEHIQMNGVAGEVLPDSRFPVTLDNGHELLAYSAGKMCMHRTRIVAGVGRPHRRRAAVAWPAIAGSRLACPWT